MEEIITVDARGLSCPQPVLVARRALREHPGKTVEVLVDTATSRDNVRRLGEREGCQVTVEEQPTGGFRLMMRR